MALTNIDANIDLDVYDHDLTPTTIKAIALDSETRYVAAALLWERNPYSIPQTAGVTLTVLRPDNTGVQVIGNTYSYDANGTTMYGAYAELTQLAIAIKGTCQAQFKLTDGDQILRTEIFYINNGQALDADISTWAGTVDGHNLDEMASSIETLTTQVGDLDDRIDAIEQGAGGVPTSVKQALLTLLKTTAYTNTGLTDEIAIIESWASASAELVSISASYSGGTVSAGASLDSLRSDLTVIASYQDSTTETVTGYTLSGTLTEGTQTVTVSYGGKTTTFTVTVVSSATVLNSWDFTDSLVDSVGGVTAVTTATQDSTGLHFVAAQKYAEFPIYAKDRTYEIDVDSIVKNSPNIYGRLFMIDADSVTGTGGSGYLLTGANKGGDLFYTNGAWETNNVIVSVSVDADGSYYSGSTVGFYIDADGYISVYKDGVLLGTSAGALSASYDGANVYFGSSSNQDALYNATFTGFRVYDGNKYGGE